ncbi:hypothetical protein N7452_009747 [Penicillium brevicompactum]|uniref:Uncharacterized protein n=1 Tax=Penicillium brevicompactum TaxID=5074 RepID=A0A9W9UAD7_PENBR|nr:hypothetical protein N7452_009747 [Penicillium brevicompactum]
MDATQGQYSQNFRNTVELAHQLRTFHAAPATPYKDTYTPLLLEQLRFLTPHAKPRVLTTGFEFPPDWSLESRKPLKKAVKDLLRLVSKSTGAERSGFPTGCQPWVT